MDAVVRVRMEVHMWWKRKNKESKSDWKKEGIDKMVAFRKRGETFRYLGVTMLVTGHWEIVPFCSGFDIIPRLKCDYVDAHGVLHNRSFGLGELPTLERESSDANAPRQDRREATYPARDCSQSELTKGE